MALGNKYRYKKPNKIKIKSLALTSSIELYQSFGENKVLICGEWTNVDSNMKLLVESVWNCCFQVSIRFLC